MTSLVDFSDAVELISDLDGNAQKTRIQHDGHIYILKFGEVLEPNPARPLQGSYAHSPLSEHVGSTVFTMLGIDSQETLVGVFKGREVVACRDFVIPLGPDKTLVQFRSIENSVISSSQRGRSPRLDSITAVISTHPFFDGIRDEAMKRYWDTFIGDAIIGNFDRHAGNWGYIAIVDPLTRIPERVSALAPVYDCGSSMAPRLAESAMGDLLGEGMDAFKQRALAFPKSRLIVSGTTTIGYRDLLMTADRADLRARLFNLASAIGNMDIRGLVDSIPTITDTRRDFYEAMLESRIEHILQPAYELACREHGLSTQRLREPFTLRAATPWTMSLPQADAVEHDLSNLSPGTVAEAVASAPPPSGEANHQHLPTLTTDSPDRRQHR